MRGCLPTPICNHNRGRNTNSCSLGLGIGGGCWLWVWFGLDAPRPRPHGFGPVYACLSLSRLMASSHPSLLRLGRECSRSSGVLGGSSGSSGFPTLFGPTVGLTPSSQQVGHTAANISALDMVAVLFCETLSCQSCEPYLHRLPGLWVSVGV